MLADVIWAVIASVCAQLSQPTSKNVTCKESTSNGVLKNFVVRLGQKYIFITK